MRVFVNLSDTEALAAARGKLKVLVRPLKEQPPEGYNTLLMQDYRDAIFEKDEHRVRCAYTKRFPVGSELWLRETWGWHDVYTDDYICRNKLEYKSDHDILHPNFYVTQWLSPVTMPAAAVRHKLLVKSNRVCLVNEVTTEEWFKTGALSEWWVREGETPRDQFTRRYPKLDFDRTWVEVVGI